MLPDLIKGIQSVENGSNRNLEIVPDSLKPDNAQICTSETLRLVLPAQGPTIMTQKVNSRLHFLFCRDEPFASWCCVSCDKLCAISLNVFFVGLISTDSIKTNPQFIDL